jgi:hypothetical protein
MAAFISAAKGPPNGFAVDAQPAQAVDGLSRRGHALNMSFKIFSGAPGHRQGRFMNDENPIERVIDVVRLLRNVALTSGGDEAAGESEKRADHGGGLAQWLHYR